MEQIRGNTLIASIVPLPRSLLKVDENCRKRDRIHIRIFLVDIFELTIVFINEREIWHELFNMVNDLIKK